MNGYDYILQWLKRSRLTIPLHNRKGLYCAAKICRSPITLSWKLWNSPKVSTSGTAIYGEITPLGIPVRSLA